MYCIITVFSVVFTFKNTRKFLRDFKCRTTEKLPAKDVTRNGRISLRHYVKTSKTRYFFQCVNAPVTVTG